jgi:hypothetical protein
VGLALYPFVTPLMVPLGISRQTGGLVFLMALVLAQQVVRVFVLVWAPLEKRLIMKRLAARGISAAQLQPARLVGISDPTRSSFKRFGQVEEDIGALWIGPQQLIYWGDSQEFAISREQLAQVERKADAGGTSMLGGITHVILHVRLPDGSTRQIRLHTEGYWTMAAKGTAMDDLEAQILQWHESATVAASAAAKG